MKAWTHMVLCREADPSKWGPGGVRAVQAKDGTWRSGERKISDVPYGSVLTEVTVLRERIKEG